MPRTSISIFTQLLNSQRDGRCHFSSTEAIRTVRDGEPRTATSTFTQLLSSEAAVQIQCCFTSTETIRTNRDGEPRTATSTFTQLLSSETRYYGYPADNVSWTAVVSSVREITAWFCEEGSGTASSARRQRADVSLALSLDNRAVLGVLLEWTLDVNSNDKNFTATKARMLKSPKTKLRH